MYLLSFRYFSLLIPLTTFTITITTLMTTTNAAVKHIEPLRQQFNANYVRALMAYKRLEKRGLTQNDLRAIETIGLLNGAMKVKQQIETNLVAVVKDFLLNTNMNDTNISLPKIDKIEQQLMRDRHALQMLTSAMDLAITKINNADFKREMRNLSKSLQRSKKFAQIVEMKQTQNFTNRIATLRKNIVEQMDLMQHMIDKKVVQTLDYLIKEATDNSLVAKASNKMLYKRAADTDKASDELRVVNSVLTKQDFRQNLIETEQKEARAKSIDFNEFERELNDLEIPVETTTTTTTMTKTAAKAPPTPTATILPTLISTITAATMTVSAKENQDENPNELMPNNAPAAEGGGLLSVIAGLSGGEGGSDVGALVGALTGIISTLFGPGGLDVEALINTGTSLIAGLLAGDKNFGTILGQYVGTAFDGLSGGGGAINNGRFIGNFLGTVVSSLSADPEDDDKPPQPFVFAQNVLRSFLESKTHPGTVTEIATNGEKRSLAANAANTNAAQMAAGKSFDSGGFVRQIFSHIVGGIVGLILNASFGAVGGASQASTSAFGGSSLQTNNKSPAAFHTIK